MARQLIRDTTIYGLGTLLTRGAGVLLIPVYTRHLPVSEYGTLYVLNLILEILGFICLFGVSTAAQRYYFEPSADDQYRRQVYGTALTIVLVAPPLVLLAALPGLWASMDLLLPAVSFFPYVLLVGLIASQTPISRLYYGLLRVQRKPVLFASLSVATVVLQFLAIIVAVVHLDLGLRGVLVAQLVVAWGFGLVALISLARFSKPGFSPGIAKRLFAFGIPLIPYFLLASLGDGAARFSLANLGSAEELGLFALAAQLGGIVRMFSASLDNALLPHFLERAAKGGAETELGTLTCRYLAVTGILALGVAAGAGPFVQILASAQYQGAVAYAGPMALVAWLYTLSVPSVWSMNHSRRTGFMAAIQCIAVAILLGMLALLLGYLGLGVAGVILALMASSAFTATAGTFVAQRNYRVLVPWRRVALISAWLLGCGILVELTRDRLDDVIMEALLHAGIFAVATMSTLRLAGINNLAQLIRPKRKNA